MPSASPWSKLSGELAGGAVTLHLLCKTCCLEMDSGGKWEDMRRKESAASPKWGSWVGGRVKSVTVQMFPFLPPNSSFVLCTLLFFLQTLISDLMWNQLLTCLSIVHNHAVSQVFPTVTLRITWWVREETVRGQIFKTWSQKWGSMQQQCLSREKRKWACINARSPSAHCRRTCWNQ